MTASWHRFSEKQRALLHAIATLQARLNRPPSVAELARELGMKTPNVTRNLADAEHAGRAQRYQRNRYGSVTCWLTPLGRRLIELPISVYIAWPMPPPAAPPEAYASALVVGRDLADWVLWHVPGGVPISPYLHPYPERHRVKLDSVAQRFAAGADGVIVIRDRLLVGRPDVAAAGLAGLPISYLTDDAMGEVAKGKRSPWSPHNLVAIAEPSELRN